MTTLALAVVTAVLAGMLGGAGLLDAGETRPRGLGGVWISAEEAVRRTGLSAALWRRWARHWAKAHLARKVTRNVGKVRSEWLIHASADPRLTALEFESACQADLTRTPARYAAWALGNWRWAARFRGLRSQGLSASEAYRQVIAEARQEGRKLSRRSLEVYTRTLTGPEGRGVAGLVPGYKAAQRAAQRAERGD